VRPHELEIDRMPGPDRVAAQVVRLTPLGAALRVELDAGATIGRVQAELDRGRADALGLRASEPVFLGFRHARVFEEERRAA